MTRDSRLKLWMFLATALVLSVAALLGILATRPDAASSPVPEGPVVVLKVIDDEGRPVPDAHVFVLAEKGAPPAHAGSWSEEKAMLTLPKAATPVAVAVQARGFRSEVVEALAEDRTFALRRGFLVKLKPSGEVAALPEALRLVFQINPTPSEDGALSEAQRESLIDLIDARTPAPDERLVLPRSGFGFAIWASVAADGLRLPLPGHYAVRWGLLDTAQGVWFSLKEATTSSIRVGNDERTQVFEIPVPQDEVERTRRGLAARIAGLDDDAENE